MKINLNENIKVKLTDFGKDVFYHRFDEINERLGREAIQPRYPSVDENGYSTFQLWVFIDIFGEYINWSSQNVIEPLEIIYEGE